MEEIKISMEEYRELLKTSASAEAFVRFIKYSQYAPTKEECASFFGVNPNDFKESK